MISNDHILIDPSSDALRIKFVLCGFNIRLEIGSECARKLSSKPPPLDHTLMSPSALPVTTTLADGEYTQQVMAILTLCAAVQLTVD